MRKPLSRNNQLILGVIIRLATAFLVILIVTPGLQAQEKSILHDSTRQVYGPKTSLFIKQDNIKYNQGGYVSVDTSIATLHRFSFVHQYKNRLQDLGNNGTAAKPIFYRLPDQIGASSGFNAYNLYFKRPQQFKYYDTKSPYSQLYLVVGEKGRSVVRVPYSRNVTKNWNISATFQSITADKQFGQTSFPVDRNVISYAYDFFTHFKTGNEKYQLLANFSRMNHRVKETGGIKNSGHNTKDLFLPNVTNNLKNAESRELRQQYHVYQQYDVKKQLQAYHEFDWLNTFNYFEVKPLNPEENSFLGNALIDTDSTKDRTLMRSFWNEVGLKGDLGKLFYLSYYRRRDVDLNYKYLDDINNLVEHYAGFQTRYRLKDSTAFLNVRGEYLFGGFYKVYAAYTDPTFDLAYQSVQHKPSFLAQDYRSNHREWHNSFSSPTTTQVHGGVTLRWPFLLLRPNLSLTRVNKPIYFNQYKAPAQASTHATILSPGVDINLTLWRHIHADNSFIFTDVQGPESKIFKVPAFLLNTRLYYTKCRWFNA